MDPDTWYKACEEDIVKIWVENPEIHTERKLFGTAQKQYTTFRVLMKTSSGDLVGVRHRFSEFEMLRESLRSRYMPFGIFVPLLPSKRLLGNTESEFIKERMQGLTLFCENVVASPFLRHDRVWKDFMNCDVRGDSDVNMGEKMLQDTLLRVPPPSNPLVRYLVLREEVNALEKHAKAAYDSARQFQTSLSSLVKSNESLQSSVSAWAFHEQEAVRSLNGKYNGQADPVLRDGDNVSKLLGRTSTLYAEKHLSIAELPDYANVLLCPALEYELNRYYALKELCKIHDELVSFIDSQKLKLDRMDQSKYEKYQETRRAMEEKKQVLALFYKGFLQFTLPMSARDRAVNLRRAFTQTEVTMMASAEGSMACGLAYLKDVNASKATTVASACTVLEQLSIKPLDGSPDDIPPSPWPELGPLPQPCFGLLRSAQGFVSIPSPSSSGAASGNATSSSATAKSMRDNDDTLDIDERNISTMLKHSEIAAMANQPNGFDDRDSMPRAPAPPTPQQQSSNYSDPLASIPARPNNSAKFNSLLGDLTGGAPEEPSKADLWM